MPESTAQTLPDVGRDGDAWPRWQAGARRDTGRPYRDPRPATPDHRRLVAAGRILPTLDGVRLFTATSERPNGIAVRTSGWRMGTGADRLTCTTNSAETLT